MSDLGMINNFIGQKKIILYGASRSGKKFGNMVIREMLERGYQLYTVHPESEEISGVKCYPDISAVPDDAKSVLMIIPPEKVIEVLPDLINAKMERTWLQFGASSQKAIKLCLDNDIEVISNECILMFTEPVKSFHSFHRWIWKIAGKYPKVSAA